MEARSFFRFPRSLRARLSPPSSRRSPTIRTLTTTRRLRADPPRAIPPLTQPHSQTTTTSRPLYPSASAFEGLSDISRDLTTRQEAARSRTTSPYGIASAEALSSQFREQRPEHHLHVYSHKHNTHLTVSDPARKALISVSSGNLGFRKAQRGSYDAAYQLMAYVVNKLVTDNVLPQIQHLEVVFRGFGQGREAATKVLLGSEGSRLRNLVCRVVDKTRLKIGGTRSPAPRRLG